MSVPFQEMCRHAYHSCVVNGLTPVAYRWGVDVEEAFRKHMAESWAGLVKKCETPPKGLPDGAWLIYEGLPVFRMRAEGVACIGRPGNTYQGKIHWLNK